MEKFNFSYDFQTEGGAFNTCTNNKKIPEKSFSNKDAKIGHFTAFLRSKQAQPE